MIGPLERYMTPTLDLALLIADLGRTLDRYTPIEWAHCNQPEPKPINSLCELTLGIPKQLTLSINSVC